MDFHNFSNLSDSLIFNNWKLNAGHNCVYHRLPLYINTEEKYQSIEKILCQIHDMDSFLNTHLNFQIKIQIHNIKEYAHVALWIWLVERLILFIGYLLRHGNIIKF